MAKVITYAESWQEYLDREKITASKAVQQFKLYESLGAILDEIGISRQDGAYKFYQRIAVSEGWKYAGTRTNWTKVK